MVCCLDENVWISVFRAFRFTPSGRSGLNLISGAYGDNYTGQLQRARTKIWAAPFSSFIFRAFA